MPKASDIRAGGGQWELSISGAFDKQLKSISVKLGGIASGMGRISAALGVFGTTLAAPLAAAVKHFAEVGDTLDKARARTNLSTEALSSLGFAAESAGVATKSFQVAMQRFTRRSAEAAKGTGEAKAALEELDIKLTDSSGNMRGTEELLHDVADAFARVKNPADRVRLAFKLFDSEGVGLVNMLAQGSEELRRMTRLSKVLGVQMSTEESDAAAKLTDRMGILGATFGGLKNKIGAALAPALTDMAERMSMFVGGISKAISEQSPFIVTIGKAAAGVLALSAAFAGMAAVTTLVSVNLPLIGGAFAALTSPIGLVTAGLLGATAAWATFTRTGQRASAAIKETFSTTFGGIKDALLSGDLALAGKVAMAGLKLAWFQGIRGLREAWLEFKVGILNITDSLMTELLAIYASGLSKIGELLGKVSGGKIGGDLRTVGFAVSSLAEGKKIVDQGRAQQRAEEMQKAFGDIAEEIANAKMELGSFSKSASEGKKAFDDKVRKLFDGFKAPDTPKTPTAAATAVSSRGTFSATAASFLGGANSAANRIEANTRISAEALQEIVRKQALGLGTALPVI